MPLKHHFTYLEAAFAESLAAPLSARKAMLVAVLADAYADRLFAAGGTGAEDILAFRAGLAAQSEALALVFALCAAKPGGARLVTEAVEVPIADYPILGVADYMVSLYNQNTVFRVRIALPDGGRRLVHEVLAEAIAVLRALAPDSSPP
ncbi:MAG: hypothetical protein HY834_11480 [Devosia nanyangense]|uniref:Uncharacterized protein n=1 Tax=Devosia nanyangense TaxID=1228055 RepID=A0A933L3F2_9HYPH|nr:hypothetical protein [Devosia nanyangense]